MRKHENFLQLKSKELKFKLATILLTTHIIFFMNKKSYLF